MCNKDENYMGVPDKVHIIRGAIRTSYNMHDFI